MGGNSNGAFTTMINVIAATKCVLHRKNKQVIAWPNAGLWEDSEQHEKHKSGKNWGKSLEKDQPKWLYLGTLGLELIDNCKRGHRTCHSENVILRD